MNLGSVRQVILFCRDMAAQVKFYRDVLGLKVSYPENLGDLDHLFWVTFDTGECSLALHAGGVGELGQDAPKFTFFVEDLETTRRELAERGVETTDITTPAPGIHISEGRDPEGNRISLQAFK